MIANYGYADGSGKYFIIVDTDKCNGCGDCIKACPKKILEVGDDPNDPLRDEPVMYVKEAEKKKLKYTCAPCKPLNKKVDPPCIAICKNKAIKHSW